MKNTLLGTLFLSILLSSIAVNAKTEEKTKSRFEYLELFNKVLYQIEAEYYRDVKIEKLIVGAIRGMMETLDPHSSYLDEDIFDRMKTDTSGEFGGLGIEVTVKNGVLTIITAIEDTPAYEAGLQAKDKIVEINNESTIGLNLDQAVDRMRGKPGSKINLGIVREGEEGVKYFSIRRKVVKLKPVKSELVKDQYAFLRLKQFQKNSAKNIIAHLKRMKKEAKKKGGLKGIILDLRANPGGLLDEAVEVSSIFLKEGIVVSTEGRDPKNKEIRYVNKQIYKDLDTPLAVLINGASASASEIVAGALKDYGRGFIMGSRSFGKGSVQTVRPLDEKSGLKLTIAQYMTPKSGKIQAIGIKPDIELDAYDPAMIRKYKVQSKFIREIDLRNHLTSTVETEEEKEAREEKEAKERLIKRRAFEEQRKKLLSKESENKEYSASEDFQVLQAVNYLNSLNVLQKFSRRELP